MWNYVSIMLGVGFVGGPPIGAWFTTKIVRKLHKIVSGRFMLATVQILF